MTYPRIVFHHIPKCGGTSLVRGMIMTYYPLRLLLKGKDGFASGLNVRAARQACELTGLPARQFHRALLAYHLARETSPFVSGHYPFSRAVYEKHKCNWAFVTILRDPVQRWYSEYFYNRYKEAGVSQTRLDLEEYLESEKGIAAARSYLVFFSEKTDVLSTPNERDLQNALSAIASFDVVGRLENIERFRQDMKRRFGRRPFFPHINRNPLRAQNQRRPDPNSLFHKKLIDLLEPDIEIYKRTFDL